VRTTDVYRRWVDWMTAHLERTPCANALVWSDFSRDTFPVLKPGASRLKSLLQNLAQGALLRSILT